MIKWTTEGSPERLQVRRNVKAYVSCRRDVGLSLSVIKWGFLDKSDAIICWSLELIELRWHRGKSVLNFSKLWADFFVSASRFPGWWARYRRRSWVWIRQTRLNDGDFYHSFQSLKTHNNPCQNTIWRHSSWLNKPLKKSWTTKT